MFTLKPKSSADYEAMTIFGDRVALIPYSKDLVPSYHEWMKDPFLQEATCSEPLTLEEEYEAWAGWVSDPNKLTFLIAKRCGKRQVDASFPSSSSTSSWSFPFAPVTRAEQIRSLRKEQITGSRTISFSTKTFEDSSSDGTTSKARKASSADVASIPYTRLIANKQGEDTATPSELGLSLASEPLIPCGDVNMFACDDDIAEVNVMLAHADSRRSGLANEAIRLFLSYAYTELKVKRFRAKILEDNEASIKFFSDKLGFSLECRKEVFGEVWYRLDVDEAPSATSSTTSSPAKAPTGPESTMEGTSLGVKPHN
ncbi:unnamed protein product [Amoebophrya sp. A25]|nr:unnamed protein product [Amoebophrya sp. A25]|eukprot:GSA25T00012297001.1